MKVSLSWLKVYVPIEKEVSELAEALTMAGLEVEGISDRYDYLDTVPVGRIVKVRPHPDADKLKLCDVDVGGRVISVVCGAPNAKENMLVPVALPGTVLPDASTVRQSVIRGQNSEGMLCSEAELGLGTDKSGLMILDASLRVGDKLNRALKLSDPVFEVSITPNRSDCLSILGIAREVAAIQKTRVSYPDICLGAGSGADISEVTSVTIESPDHCPRYAARLVENIKIAPSPFWLQERLMSVGLRPINNIVDITNFVMMETGQPLHAFDFEQLAEHRIVVRTAREGEPFTTLDGKERVLTSNMLMICDGKKPVAVGGVMGGLNSEIEDSTTKVLIESAYFDPVSIRKTAKKLGLGTEASHRFERGVDPMGTVRALDRAAQLMVEFGGGKLVKGLIDAHPRPSSEKKIALSVKAANRLLGISLNRNQMEDLLKSVEFTVETSDEDTFTSTVPSFRVDVSRPQDLMEEIARLSGYEHIPTTFPLMPAEAKMPMTELIFRERIKDLMLGFGFTEAITYSFTHHLSCDRLRLPADDPARRVLHVLNPLTEEQSVMRTSLISGLLETMQYNIAHQVRDIKVFEAGKIFLSKGQDKLPDEIEMLAGLQTGERFDASWHSQKADCDFYDMKGVVEAILQSLKIKEARFTLMPDNVCSYTKPGHTARIFAYANADGGKPDPECKNEIFAIELGQVGEVHPEVLRNYDLKQKAFIFELKLKELGSLISEIKQSKAIPKYPNVSRDITIIVNKDIESARLLESVRLMKEPLMEDLSLFAVYEGDRIPAGNKSVSFRITYRSPDETLEDETVNAIHKRISDRLLNTFDAAFPE